MKKSIFFISLLFCAFSLSSENLKILSFNVDGFQDEFENKKDVKHHKAGDNAVWLNNICSIILDSQADIVLLQEFFIKYENTTTTKANEVKLLQNKLGTNWGAYSTAEYIKHPQKKPNLYQGQNNAIFYNRNKVTTNPYSDKIIDFSSIQNCKYKFEKNNLQLVEFFVSGAASKKFYLINVHLPSKYGETEEKKQYKKEIFAKEFNELIKLYRDLNNKNIVIGGDFNTIRKNPIMENFRATIDSENNFYCYPKGGLCTLLSKENEIESSERITPVADIDHFIVKGFKIKTETKHAFKVSNGNNGYGELFIGKNSVPYKKNDFIKNVSDHLPIIIELEI